MVQEEKPDLILLDILMPKMDGIQVAQKLRQEGINTPIIFLTNMSDVDHMSQATEIAPSEYIIKADMPIDKIVARVKEKLGIK
jgi:DNA-binding response OmpR family regulator